MLIILIICGAKSPKNSVEIYSAKSQHTQASFQQRFSRRFYIFFLKTAFCCWNKSLFADLTQKLKLKAKVEVGTGVGVEVDETVAVAPTKFHIIHKQTAGKRREMKKSMHRSVYKQRAGGFLVGQQDNVNCELCQLPGLTEHILWIFSQHISVGQAARGMEKGGKLKLLIGYWNWAENKAKTLTVALNSKWNSLKTNCCLGNEWWAWRGWSGWRWQ